MTEISERYRNFHKEQYWYAEHFVENFLNIENQTNLKILEVGTAEGGLLKYFSEKGHQCYGIEYSKSRYEFSKVLNKDSNIKFINGDITDQSTYADYLQERMNIVICRDVIEHIDNKELALKNMTDILLQNGKLFISFPPKYSPYAGHQQGAPHKMAKIPYVYFLPDAFYKFYLHLLKINKSTIDRLINAKKLRLSITKFERLVRKQGLTICRKVFYIVRPNYELRYNIKRIENPFRDFFLREILTTGAIYILSK